MLNDFHYLVRKTDLDNFGCPHCGCCSHSVFMEFLGGNLSSCDSCANSFYVKNPGEANILNYLDKEEVDKIKILDIFPNKSDCENCLRRPFSSESVELISIGMYNTPGCFISGGNIGSYHSLLIKTTCKKAAQNIISFFNGLAIAENEYVFVGVTQDNLLILNKLMLYILENEKIDANVISNLKAA